MTECYVERGGNPFHLWHACITASAAGVGQLKCERRYV